MIGQLDHKFESIFAVIEAFKQRQRSDMEASYSTLERKTRAYRKEVLTKLSSSMEELETRLINHIDSAMSDQQLHELELNKKLELKINEA